MGTKFRQSYIDFIEADLGISSLEGTTLGRTQQRKVLERAVVRYSTDHPQVITQQIVGDGTNRYALPTSWNDGFSSLRGIESPFEQDSPEWLKGLNAYIFDNGDGGGT